MAQPQPEALKLYAVTKTSAISKAQYVLQLLLTPTQWEQIQPYIDSSLPKPARSLQEILPDPFYTPQQREFVLNGTTEEEWDRLWHG